MTGRVLTWEMDVHLWKMRGLIFEWTSRNGAPTITVEISCVKPFSEVKSLRRAKITHRYMSYWTRFSRTDHRGIKMTYQLA